VEGGLIIAQMVLGPADPKHVNTSFAERQNLNVRMHTRRFTRLPNAFSKKFVDHAHSVARIHKALRTTLAMTAKMTEQALGNR
jgi:hypothetical protein